MEAQSNLGAGGRATHLSSAPSDQNALDLFAGEWTSRLPGSWAGLDAGAAGLFDDARIRWLLERIGSVEGRQILELGPLEGGHSWMLEQAGGIVTAVESNPRAYLRCLVVKEVLRMRQTRFLCGDFVPFLASDCDGVKWDLVVASGVLYHLQHPVELLARIARVTDRIFLWTHYFEPALGGQGGGQLEEREEAGFPHRVLRKPYGAALEWKGFCGGTAQDAVWMEREGILNALRHLGFGRLEIGFDEPGHPNGASFAVLARR